VFVDLVNLRNICRKKRKFGMSPSKFRFI